jgi:ElaB/YqjD/DUF883 family membrane-anchored ribosome-binding protein
MERMYDSDIDRSNLHQSQTAAKFDNIKQSLAEKMRSAATELRRKAHRSNAGTDLSGQYGPQVADWLDKGAGYVRRFDAAKVKSDIERKARENPGGALLVAGAVGLALGVLLRRR